MTTYKQVQGEGFALLPNFPIPGTTLKCRAVMSLKYPYLVARMLMYIPNSKSEARRIVEIDEGAISGATQHPDGLRLYAAPLGVALGTFDPQTWRGATDWPTEERQQLAAMCRWFADNGLSGGEKWELTKKVKNVDQRILEEYGQKWRAFYAEH